MRDLLKEYAKQGNVSFHIDSMEGQKLLEEWGIDRSELCKKGDSLQMEIIRDECGNIVEAQRVAKQPTSSVSATHSISK